LLQYVDDLLLCAADEHVCLTATTALLRHLAAEGHKVNPSKVQVCVPEVTFLGHLLCGPEKRLSKKRIEAVGSIPKPITKKQMMSFLGMTSYCRTFIANYAEREAPLSALAHGQNLKAHDKLSWTVEAEQAFVDLKLALQQAPTLGLPDPMRPFTQMVDERDGFMTSVLTQKHGDGLRPVAYFSSKLDAVARGLPPCLRAIAAAEKAVMASREFVGYGELTLLVPHQVSVILLEQKTSHLSAARWMRYSTMLNDMPNITVKRCTGLNAATLMPLPSDGEPHDCLQVLSLTCTPRPDLSDMPLTNPDLEFYVDGSSSRSSNHTKAAYAVVTDCAVIEAKPLGPVSAQAAELIALTRACELAAGKTVNIYTDSRYAFGVVHDFGALWKQRDFLRADGKPILHHKLVANLLDSIMLPKAVAVMKCAAHTKGTDTVSKGNARADAAAKTAALKDPPPGDRFLKLSSSTPIDISMTDMQKWADHTDLVRWKNANCKKDSKGVWMGSVKDKMLPCLPRHFFPMYCKITHGLDHSGKMAMLDAINESFFTKGFSTAAENHCLKCITCARHNPGRGVSTPKGTHPIPEGPFDHVMMDYIELTPHKGKKYCLVMVDMFSKWVEAMPTSKADSVGVAKMLLKEIVPRWGIPKKISSDNGSHFVNSAIKKLGDQLKLNLVNHCAYRPQSGGAVERENATLKNKMVKIMTETGLGWTDALPIALMYMRMRVRPVVGMTPFEVLWGRPPHLGWSSPTIGKETIEGLEGMYDYCINLGKFVRNKCVQVNQQRPDRSQGADGHGIDPGDWVVIKD
ncbi:MAG: RNase H family protein, partial [Cetobacterium sp.]|uniref:RNase H family protein n=1 Tax=Cetobacterium sp. TaxID=2071632 RepID=UPI003EE4EE8E